VTKLKIPFPEAVMPTHSLDELSTRVTLLERRARRWQRIALGLAALASAGAVMAFRSAASPTLEGERVVLHAPGVSARAIELSVTPDGALQAQFLGDSVALRAMTRANAFVLRDQTGKVIARLGAPAMRNVAP
jgi:hypothetical protein